jgi:hypothetical protein
MMSFSRKFQVVLDTYLHESRKTASSTAIKNKPSAYGFVGFCGARSRCLAGTGRLTPRSTGSAAPAADGTATPSPVTSGPNRSRAFISFNSVSRRRGEPGRVQREKTIGARRSMMGEHPSVQSLECPSKFPLAIHRDMVADRKRPAGQPS